MAEYLIMVMSTCFACTLTHASDLLTHGEPQCLMLLHDVQGDTIVSGDAEGVIKTWDVRKMAELTTTSTGPSNKPVNSVSFDPSGAVLAVTADTGKVCLPLCLQHDSASALNATACVHSGVADTCMAVVQVRLASTPALV